MGTGHLLKLASTFLIRGVLFKAGKKAAIKSGKVGIGAFSLLVGGYMALTLLEMRKKSIEEQKMLNDDKGWDKETVAEH